jgi:hypothetical protein
LEDKKGNSSMKNTQITINQPFKKRSISSTKLLSAISHFVQPSFYTCTCASRSSSFCLASVQGSGMSRPWCITLPALPGAFTDIK